MCGDLGFSPADRHENLRRIAEIARLAVDAGTIALTAFISPLREDCGHVRQIVGAENVGSYAIRPGGLSSDNYTVSFADGALTIAANNALNEVHAAAPSAGSGFRSSLSLDVIAFGRHLPEGLEK